MKTRVLVLIAAAAVALRGRAAADFLYVDDDAPPGGDGLGWSTAIPDLLDALEVARRPGSGIDEIRVAQGFYRPDLPPPLPEIDCCYAHGTPGCGTPECEAAVCALWPVCCEAPWDGSCVILAQGFCGDLCFPDPPAPPVPFELIDGVAMRGGFAGLDAADPDARDPDKYPSVLDGDVAGDDGDYPESCCAPHATPGCSVSECQVGVCEELPYCCETSWDLLCAAIASYSWFDCHFASDCPEIWGNIAVVKGTGTGLGTLFSGFTVTRGRPGLFLYNGSATVEDCTFTGNTIAGIQAAGFVPHAVVISGCTFSANAARGLTVSGAAGATVTGCDFSDNAGGIAASHTTVTGCTFTGNRALSGGGMYLSGTAIGCTFTGNQAFYDGGGMTLSGTAIACTFTGNEARAGGGIASFEDRSRVIGCTFQGNNSTEMGGGAYVDADDFYHPAAIVSSLFVGNTAARGAGVYSSRIGPVLANCTLTGNMASEGGGALAGPSLAVINSILWDNAPDQVEAGDPRYRIVLYSDVQGGYPGTGNIDADPLFADAPGGDYRLAPGSPCIDAGDSRTLVSVWSSTDLLCDELDLDGDGDTLELIPVDFDGMLRFFDDPTTPDTGCAAGAVVDMGAWEFAAPASGLGVLQADLDGDGEIGVTDLLIVLAEWGPCDDPCCLADCGLVVASQQDPCHMLELPDGVVDEYELYNILGLWGK